MQTVDEINNIKKNQVARVMCADSLLFFTRYFFKKLQRRKFVLNRHHEIICEALERVLTGKCKRLIINIAPRYGKTELAVKNLIGHGLALNPAAKFIHLSYSDDLALDNSEKIKDMVESAEYQALFPEVKVKRDSKAKDKWYTTQGGGVLARAAGGAVTGFGAGNVDELSDESLEPDKDIDEFIDTILAKPDDEEINLEKKFRFQGCIVVDDPIKPEDADQDTIREKVNSRFDSTIRNRVNSRDTPIVIIMQRLHPNDLCGYLQREDEQDEWEIITLPCINELNNTYGLIPGDALWSFRHTRDELDKMKISNEIVFERQYMQNPQPKAGLLFPLRDLKYFDYAEMETLLDDADFTYACADPADEGGDDFAAGPFKLIGDKIYLDNVIYNTNGMDHNEPEFTKMVLINKAMGIGVEGVLGWQECAERIREALEDKDHPGEFRVLKPRVHKHTRITNRSSFIRNNFVFRRDYAKFPEYDKFMRNLGSYKRIQEPGKKNKHDDAPDLLEMAAGYFERNFPHLWPTFVKAK